MSAGLEDTPISRPTWVLEVVQGEEIGQIYRIADETIIGRAFEVAIRPSDRKVSRYHARLRPRGALLQIEDLGSMNGTFVNDERLNEPSYLRLGDRIRVGATVLIIRSG